MRKRWLKRALAMIVVVDFLVALVLVQQDILAHMTINQRIKPPSIQTLGVYAITQTAPKGNINDVDLWVQDPQGNISYYANSQAGLMDLQHDVIPGATETQGASKGSNCDCEETILRGTVPGTYTVNLVLYLQMQPGTEDVVVTLWKINGVQQIAQKTIKLTYSGQEVTAFEFTVDSHGNVTKIQTYPRSLVTLSTS